MRVTATALLLALSLSSDVGAFGPGTILNRVARVDTIANGGENAAAVPFRRLRPVAMGYLDDLSAAPASEPKSFAPSAGGVPAPAPPAVQPPPPSVPPPVSPPPPAAAAPPAAPSTDEGTRYVSENSIKDMTSAAAENLKELSDAMPDRMAVKSALSSFSSYMDGIAESSEAEGGGESEATKQARLEELEAALAATKSRIESVADEIDGLMVKAVDARAEATSSPPPPAAPAPAPAPAAPAAVPPPPAEAAAAAQTQPSDYTYVPPGSTMPTSRSIVPVNEATVEFTSGLIAGIVGLALGGPVAGAVAAAAANFASRTEGELDAGDVVRAVSKSAIQVYNYLSRLDTKYETLETAKKSLEAAYSKLEREPNADPLFARRLEKSLERTAARMAELNERYDLVDSGFVALGVAGDLVEITLNKIDNVNERYKLTDRAWSAVTSGVRNAKSTLPLDREW